MDNRSERATPTSTTSPIRIALSWALVSAPLLWGVYQTLLKSLALFK